MGNYCHGCYFRGFCSGLVVGVGVLVVGGGCFWGNFFFFFGGGVFALVMDFIEIILTSPPGGKGVVAKWPYP